MFSKRLGFLLALNFCFTLAIPALSFFVADGIYSRYDRDFLNEVRKTTTDVDSEFSITAVCQDTPRSQQKPALRGVCDEISNLELYRDASLATGCLGTGLIFLILLAGLAAQKSRLVLAFIFNPGLRITQLAATILMLSNGVLAVLSIYHLEAYLIGKVHIGVIAMIGLGAGGAALGLVTTMFKSFRASTATVMGIPVNRSMAPSLWKMIDEIAFAANTATPDNLILGMTPNFFVTESKVATYSNEFEGRTIYLSVPFCRLLSLTELKAIIAHELGHFAGKDTKFSKHFYPIYRGAQESIHYLSHGNKDSEGPKSVVAIPALFLMALFMNVFETIESKIGRDRELEADKLSSRLFGNNNIALALVKVHAFAGIWSYVESKMVDALKDGKQIVNAASFFEDIAFRLKPEFVEKDLEESRSSHPTDSHPTLKVRLQTLGLSLDNKIKSKIQVQSDEPASKYIDEIEVIELALTDIEHTFLSARFSIPKPSRDEVTFDQVLLKSMLSLAMSDDKMLDDEIEMIKEIYKTLLDKELSSETLKNEIEKMKGNKETTLEYLERSCPSFNDRAHDLIMKSILLVSAADGEIQEQEKVFINQVSKVLKISTERFAKIYDETFKKAS